MGLEEGTSSGEGTWCGEGIKCFNNEPVDNEFRYECMNDSGDGSSGSNSEELQAVISNGSFKESKPQPTTEMCQHVLFEVIISEKFTSLYKFLFDNFQGIKLDSLFHLSLMNSRMKDGAYEQSPMLFSSDIQHVPSFPDDIAMALIEEELGHPCISRTSVQTTTDA
ncbi:hypothetical protein V6N13_136343 [Hibiscus sabdariffa]